VPVQVGCKTHQPTAGLDLAGYTYAHASRRRACTLHQFVYGIDDLKLNGPGSIPDVGGTPQSPLQMTLRVDVSDLHFGTSQVNANRPQCFRHAFISPGSLPGISGAQGICRLSLADIRLALSRSETTSLPMNLSPVPALFDRAIRLAT
jgi:hypothetical protein